MIRSTLVQKARVVLLGLMRIGLWLLLIGLPLMWYSVPVMEVVATYSQLFGQYQDIYIAGQPLHPAPPHIQWEQLSRLPAVLLVVVAKAGPAVLLGAAFSAVGLLAGGWLLRQRWPGWRPRRPATLLGLAGRLLMLLVLAYGLGCLAHLLLPAPWFNLPVVPAIPELRAVMLHEEYLWPFALPGVAPEGGWTIYNPIVLEALDFQPLKASSIKLGTLLATLLLYHRATKRSQPRSGMSVKLAKSV